MDFSEDDVRIERMPAEADGGPGWDIIRADPAKTLSLCVVSTDLFGCRTHYFKGRTTPCRKSDCEACAAGHLNRWHGYLFAVRSANSERVILEYTPPSAVTLDNAFKEYKTLRGLVILVSRTSNRANAKVTIAIKHMSPNAHKLPLEPLMWPTLSKIWGVRQETFVEFDKFDPAKLAPCEIDLVKGTYDFPSHDRDWQASAERDLPGQLKLPGVFNGNHVHVDRPTAGT